MLVAVGQENAFPWIERDLGIEFDEWGMPVLDKVTLAVDAAAACSSAATPRFGPKNIIWAVAHGHDAAISIDQLLHGEDVYAAPGAGVNLVSQKMGIHEWSYDNDITERPALQGAVARQSRSVADATSRSRSSSASTSPPRGRRRSAASTATCRRCSPTSCASSATPASTSARWTASPSPPTATKPDLRTRLQAPALNLTQDLYVSGALKTGRVMVKDEDVCLHCGLCAERCPTGAWDMQKFLLETHAGRARRCRDQASAAVPT